MPDPPAFAASLMAAATDGAVHAFVSTAAWDDAQAVWMEEQLLHVARTLTPPKAGGFSDAVAAATADVDRVVRGGLGGPGWPGGGTAPGRAGGRAGRLPALPPATKLRLVAYGSTAAGLASPGGDCDLALAGPVTVPWHAVDADAAARDPALGSDVDAAAAASPDGPVTCDVADLAPRAKATLLLSLVRRLEARRVVAGRAHLLLHARVPIARVRHAATGVELDLSASGERAASKMAAVGALAAAGPPVAAGVGGPLAPSAAAAVAAAAAAAPPLAPALVRLVKAWARAAGVGDGAGGTFNSFALTLLALHHLQGVGGVLTEWAAGGGGGREVPATASAAPAAAAAALAAVAAAGAQGGGGVLPRLADLADGLGLRVDEAGAGAAADPAPALAAAAADAAAARARLAAAAAPAAGARPPPTLALALGTFFARTAAALDVWAAAPPSPEGHSVAADVWTGGWAAVLRPPGPPPRRAAAAAVADPADPADNCARTLEPGPVAARVADAARVAAGALLDLSGPLQAADAWEALFTDRARRGAGVGGGGGRRGTTPAPPAPAAPAAPHLGAAYAAAARSAARALLGPVIDAATPGQEALLSCLGLVSGAGRAGGGRAAPAVPPPSRQHTSSADQSGVEGGHGGGGDWTTTATEDEEDDSWSSSSTSSSEWTEASTPPESEVEAEAMAGLAV